VEISRFSLMSDTIPRRIRVDQMTAAELAIREARIAVEAVGCDVRLTDAVNFLSLAQDKVADFVDNVPIQKRNPDVFPWGPVI
jgi:hypothetical protein